jgi:hypothetical protein
MRGSRLFQSQSAGGRGRALPVQARAAWAALPIVAVALLACCALSVIATGASAATARMYVTPTSASPTGYSLTPSKTEPYATCEPQPPGTAVCLSISPPEGAPLSYPGGGIKGTGWAATELREAYKIPATGGAGQTVAIVDAFGDTHAEEDLEMYRETYGLPECSKKNGCFEKVNQKGETANYPSEGSSEWIQETSLDLDIVSAICPECHIRLVQANNAGSGNLYAAEDTAAEMVGKVGATTEISNSWEFFEENTGDSHFNHPGVPVVVAAGDIAAKTFYPAVVPTVISVGGTVLKEDSKSPRGWSETVWPSSSGGCSQYETSKPFWQTDWGCANRTDNDVSADAQLGISIYDGAWTSQGGTSASAPIVAAVEAHASKAVREEGAEAFYDHALFKVDHDNHNSCNSYPCPNKEGYYDLIGWGSPDGPLEKAIGLKAATTETLGAGDTSASLYGYVNPGGAETTYKFEYGQTTSYGHSVPVSGGSAGSSEIWQGASASLSGLEKDRTYHYRLTASHGAETVYGQDTTFATIPWTVKAIGTPSGVTGTIKLHSLSCTSPSACTAVGNYPIKGISKEVTLAERWDGKSWSVQATPTPEGGAEKTELGGVSCATATFCLAVGHSPGGSKAKALAESWNGSEWAIQPLPKPEAAVGSTLSAVSCTSSSSCTAVGNYTDALEKRKALAESWNGSEWTIQLPPGPEGGTDVSLLDVSCTSSSFCAAVGEYTSSLGGKRALAESWNGSEWTIQPLPSPEGATSSLLSGVSCISSSWCTAVGYYGEVQGPAALVQHWNGAEWAVQPAPNAEKQENLDSVSCSSAVQCVGVGHLDFRGSVAEIWNGTEWAIQGMPKEGGSELYGVSCPSGASCLAVSETSSEQAELEAPSAPVAETVNATSISGASVNLNGTVNPNGVATKYWFEYGLKEGSYENKTAEASAGFYRTTLEEKEAISGLKPGTTYHFRIVASNAEGSVTGKDFAVSTTVWSLQSALGAPGAKWTAPRRVSCTSSTECTAVGDYENGSGAKAPLAERWSGSEWKVQTAPSPSGAKWAALAGVSCTSSTACTAVGRYLNSSSVEVTLAERWNGSEWSVQSTPNPSGAKSSWLEDVSCTSSTACTAVGRYLNSSSVEVSLAERWNGSEWSVQSTPNPSGAKWSRPADVSCSSSTACLAVGSYESSGSVRMTLAEAWNGATWSIQTTPNPVGSEWNSLKGVWCASATECMAVGGYRASGEYVTLAERLKEGEWSIQSTSTPKRGILLDVSCGSTSWCEASGTNEGKEPLAEHWDGNEWKIESTSIPTGVSVSTLEGVSCATMCLAVGYTEATNPSALAESYPLRPPYAKTESVTNTTSAQTTLNGIVNPGGAETSYYFEYGPTTSYGTKTSKVTAGSGMSNSEASQGIAGLAPEAVYHFRIVAENSEGTTYGQDLAFTTTSTTGKLSLLREPGSSGEAGFFKAGGVVRPAGLAHESIAGRQVTGTTGSFVIPAKSTEITCSVAEIVQGAESFLEDEYEDFIAAAMKAGGSGQAKLVFSGCVVNKMNAKTGALEGELKSCTTELNKAEEHHINTKVLFLVRRHEGTTYLLFEPSVSSKAAAEENEKSTSLFTTLHFGGTCSLAKTINVTGGVAVKAPTTAKKPKLAINTYEFEEAGGVKVKILPSKEQALLGAQLKFGESEAFLKGEEEVELTGSGASLEWGAL